MIKIEFDDKTLEIAQNHLQSARSKLSTQHQERLIERLRLYEQNYRG